MTTLRVLLNRCLEVLLRRRREARLSEEIRMHLDLLTDEYLAQGLAEADARAAARRAFGGIDRVREDHRSQRGLPLLDAAAQDARFAARLLAREPGFALAVTTVLAVGIGIANMQFAMVNAHTIRGLPMPDADRVLYLSTIDQRSRDRGLSYPEFRGWRERAGSFAAMAAFTSRPVVVDEDGERAPERLRGTYVSADGLRIADAHPILGRTFAPGDDARGAPAVALLDERLWQSRYDRDPGVVGQSVRIDGTPATIIGVLPRESGFPATADVWIPLAHLPTLDADGGNARTLRAIGRVRDGIGIAAAQAEADAIVSRLTSEQQPGREAVGARAVPVNDQFLGRTSDPTWIAFMAAGLLVVLISSANAANLMLGRSLGRAREMAVRASLGATRRRILAQLLMEGAVLAAIAAVAGLAVAALGIRLFASAVPPDALPYWLDYTIDGRVLAVLISVSAGTVFVFALLPALQASKADPNGVLKEGSYSGSDRRRRRWTTAFLAAEIGLAVVFLAQFVVSVRNSRAPLPTDETVETARVLTSTVTLPADGYDTPDRRAAFYSLLLERVGGQAGITTVSLASAAPRAGARERRLATAGQDPAQRPAVWTVAVAPRYFETLGVALIRGRDFESGDADKASAIVNERFVDLYFGGRDARGESLALAAPDDSGPGRTFRIVGVAPAIRQRSVPTPDPVVYLPFASEPPETATLLVRSDLPAGELGTLLRTQVRQLDRTLPLYSTRTMAQAIYDSEWVPRLSNNLFRTLTFVAVLLTAAGLYAVTSYSVGLRTREIGVRVALGAAPSQIVRLVGRRVVAQLAIGLAAGLALTRTWAWLFFSGRAGLSADHVWSLMWVAGILAAIAAVACAIPARRAARLNPVDAIRQP
jgi:predicted permease